MKRTFLAVFFLVLGVMFSTTLTGCGSGGSGGSQNPSINPDPAIITTINVTPATASVVAGKTSQLSVEAFDQNGRPISASINWSSSDTAIATVSNSGLVTAMSAGKATITATSGSISGKAVITVTPALWKINAGGKTGKIYANGTDVYVAIDRSGDSWLAKFNAAGKKQWEVLMPSTITGVGFFGGVIEVMCKKQDPSLYEYMDTAIFVRLSASNGDKVAPDLQIKTGLGNVGAFAVDPSNGHWYVHLGTRTGMFVGHADADGNLLGYYLPDSSENILQIVVGPDAVYLEGSITSKGTLDRHFVKAFSKELVLKWPWQQRPFEASNGLDNPGGVVLIDGNLCVATTDYQQGNQGVSTGALSIVNTATGKTTKEFTVGKGVWITSEQQGFLLAVVNGISPTKINIADGSISQPSAADAAKLVSGLAMVGDTALVSMETDQLLAFDLATLTRK